MKQTEFQMPHISLFGLVAGFLFLAASQTQLIAQSPRELPAKKSAGKNPAVPGMEKSIYEKKLLENGVEPSAEGVKEFANRLRPSGELIKQIELLFEQLSSPIFSERRDAFTKLKGFPIIPKSMVDEYLKSPNPEVRYRAGIIAKRMANSTDALLNAVLVVVRDKELPGLLGEVVQISSQTTSSTVHISAERAAEATATPDDLDVIIELAGHSSPRIRILAVKPMAKVAPQRRAELLGPLLDDKDELVQLQAAVALSDIGDRRCLHTFLRLLESKKTTCRARSVYFLRMLTGQKFKFYASDRPEIRAKRLKLWKEWIAQNGESAKLKFPVELHVSRSNLEPGHMLLCYGHLGRIIELDEGGNEIFEYKGKNIWSAEKLPNGNILAADYTSGKVIQLDMTGRIVWEFSCPTCLNTRPLVNGNILAVSHTGKKVMEVTPDKKVVWEVKTNGLGCDAHRLENGNTLIAEDGIVRIVDPEGENVWEHKARHPYGVEPLSNGNILICDITTNEVTEVTPDHEVVWKYRGVSPCDAYRLENGNTLITDNRRFIELTPEKKIVWEKKGARYGTARK